MLVGSINWGWCQWVGSSNMLARRVSGKTLSKISMNWLKRDIRQVSSEPLYLDILISWLKWILGELCILVASTDFMAKELHHWAHLNICKRMKIVFNCYNTLFFCDIPWSNYVVQNSHYVYYNKTLIYFIDLKMWVFSVSAISRS